MLGRFFNSFYYGKAGKGDYTPENLPKNRRQLFFETLRVRWSAMVRLNLLYILFWLPALLWTGWNYLAMESVLGMQLAGELAEAEVTAQLTGLAMMYLLILAPCIAITGPATAGASYVTRNWARDQHSFLLSDFWDTFKSNWKQALPISIITGALPPIVYVCWRFYGQLVDQSGILYILPQMLVVLIAFVWLLSLEVVYTLMVTYKLSFRQLLRNALILAVGRLPIVVGVRLLTLVVPAIAFAVSLIFPATTIYALLLLVAYYLLFGFVFNRFLYASLSNALCERFINTHIEGAPVNVGLRQYTDEDYEDDPHMPESLKQKEE